tara:strand:+ start:1582 stop:2121 length:540 start_codon:yes stop_codon:yes gene_type:complete
MDKLKIFNEFLDRDEAYETLNYFSRNFNKGWDPWVAEVQSPTGYVPGNAFWRMKLSDEKLFSERILKKIESKTNKRFTLLDVYANGQTNGQDGSWHVDDSQDGTYTFLLYMTYNPIIESTNYNTIGGYTGFSINGLIINVEPFTNRGVLFRSNIIHRGLAPQKPNIFRISIAYKLKEIT